MRPLIKYIGKVPLEGMAEKRVEVVAVIKRIHLVLVFCFFLGPFFGMAQQENSGGYKKRVLESAEVDILSSYYNQDGNNASVTGGIGSEALNDLASSIVVSIPLNEDDVLSVDVGISTYTSASSSNLNPFDGAHASGGLSGASRSAGRRGGDDDDEGRNIVNNGNATGSPWIASTGASRKDTWGSANVGYAHSSEDRNEIYSANASFATEYDYMSMGFGGGFTKLFNGKNTEVSLKGSVYLDTWLPQYPTELKSYVEVNGNLNAGFFTGVDILNQNGQVTNKNSLDTWRPIDGFSLISNKKRNSYALSIAFSQILGKNTQMSIFADVVKQQGWLSNPMQRVYFADTPSYYIGTALDIPNYTSNQNSGVFMLADDLERLPDSRLKIPVGIRLNHFLNEIVSIRTYYRYYFDDWGLTAHTLNAELPIKVSDTFTLYPSYRYYTQNQIDYFAPFKTHVSTSQFYTSDFDLSTYDAQQKGFGVSYTDIFTKFKTLGFGLKSIDFKYNNYRRNTGLRANYVGIGFKFILE